MRSSWAASCDLRNCWSCLRKLDVRQRPRCRPSARSAAGPGMRTDDLGTRTAAPASRLAHLRAGPGGPGWRVRGRPRRCPGAGDAPHPPGPLILSGLAAGTPLPSSPALHPAVPRLGGLRVSRKLDVTPRVKAAAVLTAVLATWQEALQLVRAEAHCLARNCSLGLSSAGRGVSAAALAAAPEPPEESPPPQLELQPTRT